MYIIPISLVPATHDAEVLKSLLRAAFDAGSSSGAVAMVEAIATVRPKPIER
jgi:hypothetical protein